MTYPVSAMERDARSELVSAAWACAYDLSPANRERWQQADEYFEALLEVLTPRGAPHERHVPPVGIPHAPTSVHLEIMQLRDRIAQLTGESVTDDREMSRTAYDTSYSSAPRARDNRPYWHDGPEIHLPQRTEYVPVSDSSPSPDRIRRQASQLRHDRNSRNSRKGNS